MSNNLPKHFNGKRGIATPTGIACSDLPFGTHYQLTPTWWPDEGEFVVVSDIGEGPMIFLANSDGSRTDGLLTPCVEGPLSQWGYDAANAIGKDFHTGAMKPQCECH